MLHEEAELVADEQAGERLGHVGDDALSHFSERDQVRAVIRHNELVKG